TVRFGAWSFGSNAGPSGDGNLASVTFTILQSGTHTIQLQNALISTSASPPGQQSVTTANASIVVTDTSASPAPSVSPGTRMTFAHLVLEGITTMRNDDRFMEFVFRQGTTNITRNVRMRTDNSGIFSNEISDPTKLSDIPVGTYDVLVNGPVHLIRKFNNITVPADNTVLDFSSTQLLAGDIVDDNQTNGNDYTQIVNNFGCVTGQTAPQGKVCTPLSADLNLDGDVDIFDYAFFVGNYNLTGEQ
ncbi:MAG: hypothetical protein AAB874_00620, partial [Patescibacteria group bacterium]